MLFFRGGGEGGKRVPIDKVFSYSLIIMKKITQFSLKRTENGYLCDYSVEFLQSKFANDTKTFYPHIESIYF